MSFSSSFAELLEHLLDSIDVSASSEADLLHALIAVELTLSVAPQYRLLPSP